MKRETTFSCKYCDDTNPHDRRKCRGTKIFKEFHADPERKAVYAERGREMMQAMWNKARLFEYGVKK